MSTRLEKIENQIKKAYTELEAIKASKSNLIEREKVVASNIESLEKQRILHIVDTYNLSSDQLKEKLAEIMTGNETKSVKKTQISGSERNDEHWHASYLRRTRTDARGAHPAFPRRPLRTSVERGICQEIARRTPFR